MPDDPRSPWSRDPALQPYGSPPPAFGSVAPTPGSTGAPAHAWLSSEEPFVPAAAVRSPDPYGPAYGLAYPGVPVGLSVAAPPATGLSLAIAGVILGGLALLGVVLLLIFVAVTMPDDGTDEDSGGGSSGAWPVRGVVAPTSDGVLSGQALAAEITRKMTEAGEQPADITCPSTPKVAQDVTTVCQGTDWGAETALVVFFEDVSGSYTLLPL